MVYRMGMYRNPEAVMMENQAWQERKKARQETNCGGCVMRKLAAREDGTCGKKQFGWGCEAYSKVTK